MIESDLDLLNRYSREGSEAAFEEVVRRHVDLVFSVAIRKVRSQQLAEEVVQSAFLDLAKCIHRLKPETVVSAWLYQVARRTAVDAVRREARRATREQMAVHMNALDSSSDPIQSDWAQVEPLLDDAVAGLQEPDRIAILLRFFEGKSFAEVGRAIGLGEDASQKRVSRALDKLRGALQRRGVTVGAGALVTLISAQGVQSAPVTLASSVATVVASGTIAGGSVAVVAAKAAATGTVQKVVMALAAATTLGVAVYQTQNVHRLERELATLRQRSEVAAHAGADRAGQAPEAASQAEAQSLNAAWTELQAERDRLVAERDAAERLARLYKEVTTLRPSDGAVPAYPTARHVTAALGRLLRKNVLVQEAFKGKRFEELSPEEQEVMRNGGVAILREVATLTEAEHQLSQHAQEPKDPIDEMTVFAYGALDLNEEQFRKVYALVRELQGEVAGLVAGGRDPSEEERAMLKAKGGGLLRAVLSPEQQRVFQLLEPHLSLVRFQSTP
jgi:RNA polymerase sigma factor (sigma-70 family)